ncbi:MAG: TetR/AcrR family transcriptional regulator [Bacteroidales bacterium]|nr:TetR/AcrR family transcriptional regulator [Bacteroidales bacterium]
MTPRTAKQFEAIRNSRRAQIMKTALELFAENGYQGTSISKISSRAKISKGLMYNYFQGKEDLLKTLIGEGINEILDLFDPNRDGVLTPEEFKFFINEIFSLMARKRKFYKLYFALMMQPSVRILTEQKINAVIAPMVSLLTDYYRRKNEDNPEMEALLMGALFDGIMLNYVFSPGNFPLDQIKDLLIKRFI